MESPVIYSLESLPLRPYMCSSWKLVTLLWGQKEMLSLQTAVLSLQTAVLSLLGQKDGESSGKKLANSLVNVT